MECYKIENLCFSYDGIENALNGISFSVERGEFITICGRSGCGKSTLLRSLKTAIAPSGIKSGSICFEGSPLESVSIIEQSKLIGFIMQDPENQIVTDKVWHELAFGAESLGLKTSEIRLRTAETASYFGIQTWFRKKTSELSGGQKQLLNLASIMVMRPSVLILDEPTSQLDPIAAYDFIEVLKRINRDFGTTVIISEHRLEDVLPVSDRVIVLNNGNITADGTPSDVGALLKNRNDAMYLAMPTPMRVFSSVDSEKKCPVTINEGREWLRSVYDECCVIQSKKYSHSEDIAVELKDVFFRYEKSLPDVLNGVSEKIYRGELFAVVGGNGTGKTTCLKTISGIIKPYRGKVKLISKKVSQLPQDPGTLFIGSTVMEDLEDAAGKNKKKIYDIAKLCGIDELLSRHPYDLSGGERQRAALAKVLLCDPDILLLDEPTKGLDPFFKKKLADILFDLKEKGITIIMVSHDIEFCAMYADRCAMIFDGAIITSGTPRDIFLKNRFYTTAAVKMSEGIIDNALTADDLIEALGGKRYEVKDHDDTKKGSVPKKDEEAEKKKRKKMSAAYIIPVFTIPLTILFGKYILDDRRFYFISLLIIMQTFIPFAVSFERRRPETRELVVIGTMCAIAVASRTAFYMLPQVKPMLAFVIITGIALGGEIGFLTGAVSAFVSNMFFGQGAWTPWQMFAFALSGLIAGLVFKNIKNRIAVSAFGIIDAVVIYGIIMNISSMLAAQGAPSWEMMLTYEISGLPFDLIHGISTAVFLFIALRPMLKKLERVKKRLMHQY